MELSIVIPVFNEEKIIESTISKILNYFETGFANNFELILINDGSTDNTLSIINQINSNRIKLITYSQNQGKGYALKKGVDAAKGEYIYIADTDLATPIEEISNFLKYIKHYDCVIGSRAAKGAKERSSKLRIIAGNIGNMLINLLLDLDIRDTQCGFKMFNSKLKTIFTSCKTNGFGYDFEFLLKARKENYSIKEIPVKWIAGKKSSVNFVSYLKTLRELFRIWWENIGFSKEFIGSIYKRSYTFRKYLTVGITSNLLNLVVFYTLAKLNAFDNVYLFDKKVPYYFLVEAIAHFAAIVVNYLLHKFYTFKVPGVRLNEILLYSMMLIVNYIAGVSILYVLIDLMGIYELIAKLISLGTVVLWTFFVMKGYIYKSK
jgi:dolichyl-phosphate beta-glucosyltransferase